MKSFASLLGLATVSLVSGAAVNKTATKAVWQPGVGLPWQIVLGARLRIDAGSPSVVPDVAAFDIDLFENTDQLQTRTTIDALHRIGKKVICYFSAGTYEPWRPDANRFAAADKGNALADKHWADELWLDTASKNVRSIMSTRIAAAARLGCDAIDPDNTDGYVSDIASRVILQT